MTVEQLVIVSAAVLSFLFSYFPALAQWYENHDKVAKRQIMAVWLLIVTASIFGLSCVPAFVELVARLGVLVECTVKSAYELVYLYLLAIMANQTVFLLSPKKSKGEASGAGLVVLDQEHNDKAYL